MAQGRSALELMQALAEDPSVAEANAVPPVEPIVWTRANFVPAPHFYNLNQACRIINDAFGSGFGCYLVGSACVRRDYRDVDVRLILDDATYDKMFRGESGYEAMWSLMCTSISLWLSQQSGLPIDFQIQRQSTANATHAGAPRRQPLGIVLTYPKDTPE